MSCVDGIFGTHTVERWGQLRSQPGVGLLRGLGLECAQLPRRVTGRAVRFGGDQGHVAGVAPGDSVGGAAGDLNAAAKVDAAEQGKVEEAKGAEPAGDELDGGGKGVVVALEMLDIQTGGLDDGLHVNDWPGVGNTRDAAGETGEFGVETVGVDPDVGQAETSAGVQDACGFPGSAGLVGEGAEGAFADYSIEGVIVKGEAFGVADLEPDAVAHAGGSRARSGPCDLGGAEVDADDSCVPLGGEENGGGADPRGNIEHIFARLQGGEVGEPAGEFDSTRVVAVAEEQSDEIDAVNGGAAR